MKFDESIPIYLQIKEEIENAIIGSSLKEEEAIPSIRTLAQQYRLNPQTISNAVSDLLNEGLLYKKRGIGMFVMKGAQQKLITRKTEEFLKNELLRIVEKGKNLGITRAQFVRILDDVYEGKGAIK
ncbi:MAG: GntR family transcriptional regulator [Candidatus Cloacimonetes bacterium]|nr:GntR family transcriptional regulator [Candidatus Cloacimonadota bacterium]